MSSELVDKTMNEIKRNWNVALQDEINPIPLALELLQQSNPAHDWESFQRLQEQLETCMEWVIENNYTGFNGAVSTFGGIVESIREVKQLASAVLGNLQEFRDQVQYKRTDLPGLWAKIEQYKLRISALTALSEMKRLREEAKQLVEKRFFVPAARILAGIQAEAVHVGREIDSVDGGEFWAALRSDRAAFLERLVEEFCQHAFLKVPGSTAQLVAQAESTFPSLQDFPNEFASEQRRSLVPIPEGSDLVFVPTEFNYAPSSNAPVYLDSLCQAAHSLGCLADFAAAVEQRLSAELFQLADADIRALHRRFHRERTRKSGAGPVSSSLLIFGKISAKDRIEMEAFEPFLRAFLETLLVKLTVILAVFWRAAEKDESGEERLMSKLYAAAAKAVHAEVRNVLGTFLKGPATALKLVSAPKSTSVSEQTLLFKLPSKPDEEEEVDNTASLLDGLLSMRECAAAKKQAQLLVVDAYASARAEFGHRPVVKASLLYLPLMFPVFSFFTRCLDELISTTDTSSDTSFLLKYMQEDFLPFVDGQINKELAAAFQPLEALLAESVRAGEAIPRCIRTFAGLFNLLIKLIKHIPAHKAAFEGLLKGLCENFYSRLNLLLQSVKKTSSEEDQSGSLFSLSAALDAEIRALLLSHPILSETSPKEEADEMMFGEKEACLLEGLKGKRSFTKSEIVVDRRRLAHICLLQRGLCLLPAILFAPSHAEGFDVPFSGNDFHWKENILCIGEYLELDTATCQVLKTVFDGLQQLALTLLFTLRLELRVQALYYIDLAMREGCYLLDEPSSQPDAYISLLCTELIALDDIVSSSIGHKQHKFCLSGLPASMQAFLISAYRYVHDINENGYLKLQATLRAIELLLAVIDPCDSVAGLDRVRAYLVLGQAGPERLLEAAKDCGYKYTLDQYIALLDSWYRIDGSAAAPEADEEDSGMDEESKKRRREYQNMIVRLQYLN